MRLRLKEDPKEWRNFALLFCGMLLVVSGLAFWRKYISTAGLGIVASVAVTAAILAFAAPGLFRGFYRTVMTASFHIGQVMGKIILGLFYLGIVTPMGLALRLAGKDLLDLKTSRNRETYWKKARKRGRLDQQF